MDNSNQQSTTQAPAQNQTFESNMGGSRSKFPIIVGAILLLLLVGGGAYYLGTKNSQSTNYQQTGTTNTQTYPTQAIVSPTPSSVTNTTWKTETIQIKKETAVSGNETINISIQIPSDWTMQAYNQPSNPNSMIKNCAYYAITSSDKITTLTIAPICAGWSAAYKAWPNDTVIVKDEGKVGNDNHSAAIVRYTGLHQNTFIYSEGFKDQNQVQDAMMIYYGSNFIPANVSVNATGVSPDTKTSDQIVSSIKAQ